MGPRKTAMKMKALAGQRWSAAEAREVLRAQSVSGLSIPVFAKEYGLSHERLYRWRRQLQSDDGGIDELEDIEFAPVVLTSERASAAVVIRVGGAQVDVADPSVVDPAWLGELVQRLGGQ